MTRPSLVKAKYREVSYTGDNTILLEDLDGPKSITNDAAAVVADVYGKHGKYATRILYYDTMGYMSELNHTNGIFSEFFPVDNDTRKKFEMSLMQNGNTKLGKTRTQWDVVWEDFNNIQSNPLLRKYDLYFNWNGPDGQGALLRRIIEGVFFRNFSDLQWSSFETDYDDWYRSTLRKQPGGASWDAQQVWIQMYIHEELF